MKKILLIIFIFLSCINVNALERRFNASEKIDGIAYYKYNGEIYYFRDAKAIKDVNTGEIAYCLDPFIDLNENVSYTESTNPVSDSNLSSNMWKKIGLIAYYGYGYQNHTDKKWISITQMVIWRTLYPNLKFEWVDNTSSKNVINPYEQEVNELYDLVNTHNVNPNIPLSIKMSVNDTIELTDSYRRLQNYSIKYSDFDAKVNGNKLTINTDNKKEGTIVLSRGNNITNHEALYFYSSNSQSLIVRGNIVPKEITIKVEVESGTITVTKVDKETDLINPQGEGELDGAVYDLFDDEYNYIKSSEIENNTAVFDDLSYGKYYLKENKAGEGYYVDNEYYEVNVNSDNLKKEIRLGNFVIKSNIKIIKTYGSLTDYQNNNMKREKNITFNIYDNNNELVYCGTTDENGELEFILPYGEYTIKQVNTTKGYEKSKDYKLVIDQTNNVSQTIVLNDFQVKVPNAYINDSSINIVREIIWDILLRMLYLR